MKQDDVEEIVRCEGVIARKQHPKLGGAISALAASGHLVAVLPGVYVVPAREQDFSTRVLAAAVWSPDLVLTDETSARLTFWPELRCPTVRGALRWYRATQRGYAFSRRVVPTDLVVTRGRLRLADPALTALDLCAVHGGDGIDRALRARATTLARMRDAFELTRGRVGNRERRWFLLDSRDEPWSAAERVCHRILRDGNVQGWRTNHPVHLDGSTYYLDIAFPRQQIVLEIDGRLHEDDPDVFENDRRRQNALVLAGWTVLRFTWRMLQDDPAGVLAAVLDALGTEPSAR